MKRIVVAVFALAIGCTFHPREAPERAAPAQSAAPAPGTSIYQGTYSVQTPTRVLTLRISPDVEGKLKGEILELGQQATFRPSGTDHKFLHATEAESWLVFTVENDRATKVTMHQRGREASGPRKQ